MTPEEQQEIFWATLDAEHEKNETARQAEIMQKLDALTVAYSVFDSFAALVNATGDYRPTINCDCDDRRQLAGVYDRFQRERKDGRRAYRLGSDRNRIASFMGGPYGWKPERCRF
jgi:hypothetical protein